MLLQVFTLQLQGQFIRTIQRTILKKVSAESIKIKMKVTPLGSSTEGTVNKLSNLGVTLDLVYQLRA